MQKNKVEITKAQYSALNYMRGLESSVFYMIVAANESKNGYVLEGTEEEFRSLRTDLYDEVEYRMQPASRLKQLSTLIYKLEPDDDLLETEF